MKAIAVGCAFLFLSSLALAQPPAQTEEQKRLMDRHKKVMLDLKEKSPDGGNAAVNSAFYLLKRRAGIPFVEDRIIDYRKKNITEVGFAILSNYSSEIVVEDIPNKMIPEFAAMLEKAKQGTPDALILHAGEFGPRGKEFLPVLEWIRDNSKFDQTIQAASDAIRKIKN